MVDINPSLDWRLRNQTAASSLPPPQLPIYQVPSLTAQDMANIAANASGRAPADTSKPISASVPGYDYSNTPVNIGGTYTDPGGYVPTDSSGSQSQQGPPVYTYSGPSAQSMAQNEFSPQFAALQGIVDQTNKRYGTAFKSVGDMWNALSANTTKQVPVTQNQYKGTGDKIQGGYTAAGKNISDQANSTVGNIANELARLGQGQAAPAVYGNLQDKLMRSLTSVNSEGANQSGLNSQLGQNQVDYINNTANTQHMAGQNAQDALTMQLQTLQAANDTKKLELTAGQAAAQNKYGLSIQQLTQAGQQAAYDQFNQSNKTEMDRASLDLQLKKLDQATQQQTFDNGMKQSQFGLDSQKALNNSKNPSAILSSNAAQMWGGDTQGASNAVNAVLGTYQNSGSGTNVSFKSFMEQFTNDHPEYSPGGLEYQRVQQLALNLLTQVGNSNNPVNTGG